MRIPITDSTRILVLTGAGVSAESGVKTFRDAGGLWEGHDVARVASPSGFADDPLLVWRFYSERRAALVGVTPNPGHHALVALEERLGDRFLLVTQNVDGLHTVAGSRRLLEMHGNIARSRCSVCTRPPFPDATAYRAGVVPVCGQCKARGEFGVLRPDLVWFGEPIATGVLDQIQTFVTAAGNNLVFLAVGTSGLVYPAASLVHVAKRVGGTSWLVNLESPANVDGFDHVVLGLSGVKLPELLGA